MIQQCGNKFPESAPFPGHSYTDHGVHDYRLFPQSNVVLTSLQEGRKETRAEVTIRHSSLPYDHIPGHRDPTPSESSLAGVRVLRGIHNPGRAAIIRDHSLEERIQLAVTQTS